MGIQICTMAMVRHGRALMAAKSLMNKSIIVDKSNNGTSHLLNVFSSLHTFRSQLPVEEEKHESGSTEFPIFELVAALAGLVLCFLLLGVALQFCWRERSSTKKKKPEENAAENVTKTSFVFLNFSKSP